MEKNQSKEQSPDPHQVFGAEKTGHKLNHFIWSCTRAYPVKYPFSLGDGKPSPNELTTDEVKMMLQKLADFGADNVFFSGAGWTGEPLKRKDFLPLLAYAAELKIKPYVKVSGWHFDETVAKALAAGDCKAIICFTGLKETDDLLRGKQAFEDSLNAAKLCKENNVPFGVSVLNTKYVVNQIPALAEFALGLGGRSFTLASLIPQPICVEDQFSLLGPLEPKAQELEVELNQMYELEKILGDKILVLAYEMFYNRVLKIKEPEKDLRTRCSMCDDLTQYEWLEILDDGKAYACAPLNLEFGDIRTDSIQEIMDRMRSSDAIKKFADRRNLKGKCGVCEFKNICGGCRARAYIYSKDSLNADPACVYQPKRQKAA
jgi:radical SAM protein with 4Fe4S-binding SPASM domain